MKRWLFGAGIVLCLGLGAFAVYEKITGDRQPPEIIITGELTYQDGMKEEELLEGVTARDEQDGDVSDSVVVETVTLNAQENTAVIHYAATDKQNNISKVSRSVKYISGEAEEESGTETETSGKSSQSEVGLGTGLGNVTAGSSSGKTVTRETETETSREESETEPESESEELEPGCPVIKLTQLSATIKIGETFNPLIYVASVEDDNDNIYALWQDIQLDGEYDVEKPGKYELTFYVRDSAGNMSNRARFVLTVEEK